MIGVQKWVSQAEEFVEDVLMVLLSVFIIILAVSALAVFATQAPAESIAMRAEAIQQVTSLTFLAKAEYFAALLLPWMVMLIGLMIAREIWMLRRRMDGIHFEMVIGKSVSSKPRSSRTRKATKKRKK